MEKNQTNQEVSLLKNFVTKSLHFRNIYIFTLSFLVLIGFFAMDPDSGLLNDLPWGASAIATFLVLLKAVPAITLLHFSRKAIADYIDIEALYKKVMSSEVSPKDASVGAGLFMIGVGLYLLALASIIAKVI